MHFQDSTVPIVVDLSNFKLSGNLDFQEMIYYDRLIKWSFMSQGGFFKVPLLPQGTTQSMTTTDSEITYTDIVYSFSRKNKPLIRCIYFGLNGKRILCVP